MLPALRWVALLPLVSVLNASSSGNATFKLLVGSFSGGLTYARVTRTFIGTEVSRTFVPEPRTGLLLGLGVGAGTAFEGRHVPLSQSTLPKG